MFIKCLLSAFMEFCCQAVKNIHFTLEFHLLFLSTNNGNVRNLFISNTGDCKFRPYISTVVLTKEKPILLPVAYGRT